MGQELLQKLDVTQLKFRDTFSAPDGTIGESAMGIIWLDFEDPGLLDVIHHELTHALQFLGHFPHELEEIDAHFKQVKFIEQATQMGIPLSQNRSRFLSHNYQKFKGNDVEYIKKFLYADILDEYGSQFKGAPDDEKILKDWLQSVGIDEDEAQSCAQELLQNPIEKIEYKTIPLGGEIKRTRTGDLDSHYEELKETFDSKGNKIETIKTTSEGLGKDYTLERFGPDDKKIETIKSFKDSDGKHVVEYFGPDDNKIKAIKSFKDSDGKYVREYFGPDDSKVETVKGFVDSDGEYKEERFGPDDKKIGTDGELEKKVEPNQQENTLTNLPRLSKRAKNRSA